MACDKGIIQALEKSPSIERLLHALKQEPSVLMEQMWEGPKALVLALMAEHLKKHVLVISGGPQDRLYTDTSFFTDKPVLEFPSWETLPGEEIAPSPDLVGKRLEVLHALLESTSPVILFAPLQAILQKLPVPSSFAQRAQHWKRGATLCFSSIPQKLSAIGYRRAPVVSEKGEFAIRGGIVDLFPLSSTDPYRIEFLGDEIEQIRTFDPISQKSIQKVESFFLCPAQECDQDPSQQSATLFDYLGNNTAIVLNDLVAIEDHWVAIKDLPGAQSPLFLSLDTLLHTTRSLQTLLWTTEPLETLSEVALSQRQGRSFYSGKAPLQPLCFEFAAHPLETKRFYHPFIPLSDAFSLSKEMAAANASELLQALARYEQSALELHCIYSTDADKLSFLATSPLLPASTSHHLGELSSGFFLEEIHLALLPLVEITHRLKPRRQKWRTTYHTPASDFHELSVGDVVVHYHNGIARFLGVERHADLKGHSTEFLVLEYSEGSKLFVPVAQSHLVSRYIGTKEETPTLSQLGSNRWLKTRSLAQSAVIGYADQLLRMHAKREANGGFTFAPDSDTMRLFEEDFPFVETHDQLQAIAMIKTQMCSPLAMDRLICGDVGYGKTEVAMRAAFKAVVDGPKQVAVLVPTTVLATQHYETFCARMANFAVRVGIVSRFRSLKQNRQTLAELKEGKIDILIGTHRLLSQDVQFHDLGLLIIDEEQRFGVRAKEHLKHLKAGVDCITLSATPIPRTLYLSLVGAREISTINTPPQDRLPIKSLITPKESQTIKNALLRELSRDGQAYFIHNRIDSIFRVTQEIQSLVPEAKIVIGHGQMSADELDAVFHAFKSGEADILVATTIIENGIDIPNANTILIDRADTFGLADLYQMRGRVGRWNRPAFAYFLVPRHQEMPELTRKRLHALTEASGFGGGMKIALRDLEIRGAGDILGTEQSGQVSSVGFHLYCKLLKKAVDALKQGRSPSFTETKLESSFDARLPDEYINESSLRMEIYHRLGEASQTNEMDSILSELTDRFGPPPPPVLWLHHLTRLRLFASTHHFTLLKFEKMTLTAERQTKTTPLKKTLPLPKMRTPQEMETEIVRLLTTQFAL